MHVTTGEVTALKPKQKNVRQESQAGGPGALVMSAGVKRMVK